MSEASYVSRAIAIGLAGSVIIGAVAFYFASNAPLGHRPQPRLIKVDCLKVEDGPTLRFEDGFLKVGNGVVGTYKFLPAVGGKHGPLIEAEATRVRQVGDTIVIEQGNEGRFWRFIDDDTVEIPYYPQNETIAHRCTA